jgi:DNA invertase Pin-like site-specific DNA recombinase
MDVVLSARVSSEEQAKGEAASIDQQLADMRALCERNKWNILETFVDCENYVATQAPHKGKMVNPSGERADRPAFLAMLDRIKTGEPDAVLCWRDDRLVRHPRVAVALEDALDLGDTRRNGKGKIAIYDATGGQIDRFTLSIKASIWREENKRRVERTQMGKRATLEQGRWPGVFDQLGYTTVREPGKRGRAIELEPEEAETVKEIFDLYDAGFSTIDIRRRLAARGAEQKGRSSRIHDWSPMVILKILKAECYTGRATWNFGDGTEIGIEIPQIITPEQFERVQAKIEQNQSLATRNAKGIYLLQGLIKCGECGAAMRINRHSKGWRKLKDGTVKRYPLKNESYQYICGVAGVHSDEPHPRPYCFSGRELDWTVWRAIADRGITTPDLIRLQIMARQEELQRQGESVSGDIAHARRRFAEVDQERAFYQRQAARGKITEQEFNARMGESKESAKYWQSEIKRLTELRDDAQKVQAGLDYVTDLLAALRERLPAIDQTPEGLKALSKERRTAILKERREIVRAMVKEVRVWADGRLEIIGILDGTEGARFELPVSPSQRNTRRWRPRDRPGSGK